MASVIITFLAITATVAPAQSVATEQPPRSGVARKTPSTVGLPGGPTMTPCTACHTFDTLFSHPVNVVPSMRVPSHLPLPDGRMTCSTCHDTRVDAHSQARRGSTALLRQPSRTLCVECHDQFGTSRAAMHATLHRAHREPLTSTPRLPNDNDCLTCHDGSLARDADGPLSGLGSPDRVPSSHPVRVGYRPHLATGDVGLRPVDEIDRRVRLFDGQVACGSCHSLFSRRDDLLVMANDASRLCLTCHTFQSAGPRSAMLSHD